MTEFERLGSLGSRRFYLFSIMTKKPVSIVQKLKM